MTIAADRDSDIETVADLLERLGGLPPERVLWHPRPGDATEADVLARPNGEKLMCELVDGVLVRKTMGAYESRLALVLGYFLEDFLSDHDLGTAFGPDATLRFEPGLVRLPDVSFVSWAQLPNRELPAEAMPDLIPDLAVEILSESNTRAEMARKRREYFAAGTCLVWIVDPKTRTARVYTAPETSTPVAEDGCLDGGEVLPGFRLALRDWFERAGRRRST